MRMTMRGMSKRTALIATAVVLAVNSLTVIVPFVAPAQVSALSGTVVTTETELRNALTGSDDVISLGNDITTTSQLSVSRPLTIEGNGKTLTAGFTGSSNNDAVLVATKPVTVSDLTVDGANKTGVQGVQIYRTSATLNNVTVKNNKKAGLNVNGSTVTVLNISTANNGASYGGIHLSKGSGVTENPTITINGRSTHVSEPRHIYKDGANANTGTVVDTNDQYNSTVIGNYAFYTLKPAPAVPANLRLNGSETCGFTTSTNWITPTWDAVNGAASYNYKVTLPNGTEYGPTNVGDVTSVSGAFGAEGTSTFSVQAVSKSGLTSAWAPACAVTYIPKPVAPASILWTTTGGSVIASDGATNEETGSVSWAPSVSNGVDHYLYRAWTTIAGNPYTEATPYETAVNGTTLAGAFNQGEGTYYFSVAAVDSFGNISEWTIPYAVTFDKTAPVVDITSTTPTLVRGTGEAGSSVIVQIDGVDGTPVTVDDDGTWQYAIIPALTVGSHAISARALDAAGNEGTSLVYSVTVFGTTAPVSPSTPAETGAPAGQVAGASTVSVTVPASIGPSALAQVLGDSTSSANTDGAPKNNGEVKGAETVAQAAATSDANAGKALGLAWYWWLLIVAGALLVIWWIVAAARRRSAEA